MSEFSDLNWFLGIQIRSDANKVEFSQESYIETLLEIFGMSDAKTAFTPALEKFLIGFVDCPSNGSKEKEEEEMKCCSYKSLIGLNYLANTSRPDETFVVRSLSSFVQNHGRQNWNQTKHVLRYLKATKNRKLIYERADEMRFVGHNDADWAGKIDSRKSTSGYCFFLNETSGAISLNSKLQSTVAPKPELLLFLQHHKN